MTAALVLTWLGACLLTAIGLLAAALAGNSDLLDGLQQSAGQPIDRQQVTDVLRWQGVIMAAWGICLGVAALSAWRGRARARTVLTAMAGAYCLYALYAITRGGAAVGVLGLIWVGTCVALLWSAPARSWYAGLTELR